MEEDKRKLREMFLEFENTLEEMKEKEKRERDANSIYSHYGWTEKQYNDTVADILADIMKTDLKSDVIAKYFKEYDADSRVRIFAFVEATERMLAMVRK